MKKRIILLFCAALLFLFCAAGCSKKSALEGMEPDAPLVVIDGNVLMTVRDLQHSLKEQEVSAQIKGTDVLKEKDLFLEKAELRILSYYAELFGLGTDIEFLQKEYDAHIVEIEDAEVYGKEKEFFDVLQKELGMSGEEYKAWNVQENLFKYNTESLLEDLTSTYRYVIDPIYMEELMLENLQALTDISELELYYPGIQKKDLSFEKILAQ